jgi:hypothetical protein
MANKIIVYATTNYGNGYVTKMGEYDSIEEIEIHIDMFAKNVIISFEYETQEEEERRLI